MPGLWDKVRKLFAPSATDPVGLEQARHTPLPPPPKPVSRADLAALLTEIDPARVQAALLDLAQPAVSLHLTPTNEDDLPLGASKIAGRPDLPVGLLWPRWQDRPLGFLAQVRLTDVAPHDEEGLLPPTGWLWFFYDLVEEPWGYDPQHRGSAQVLYWPDESATLLRTEPPPARERSESQFQCCAVQFQRTWTLPSADADEVEPLELSLDEIEALSEAEGETLLGSRLLGHPTLIQSDPRLECQLVTNGLYTGDTSGYISPQAQELAAGVADWRLLFQLDTEDAAQMMWGDAGSLYYMIRAQDLAARNFDGTWLVLQCF